jgi:hypothetical protein
LISPGFQVIHAAMDSKFELSSLIMPLVGLFLLVFWFVFMMATNPDCAAGQTARKDRFGASYCEKTQ